jgi:hypothetical protein
MMYLHHTAKRLLPNASRIEFFMKNVEAEPPDALPPIYRCLQASMLQLK